MSAPVATISPPSRSPLREMIVIALPVVATMTSYTLMQFLDKLMVSRIGPDPVYVGAQGNGGLAAFVPIAVMMGFLTVINTYVSQNLGAGRPERAPAYAWAGLWIVVGYWLAIMIPYGFLFPHLLDFMRDPALAGDELAGILQRDRMAAHYGQILIFGSLLTMAARGISQYFYGMHKPMVVLAAMLASNLVNCILNSLLIYGPEPITTGWSVLDAWFALTASICAVTGIPAMGVSGAAIATVLASGVELLIPMVVFLSPRLHRTYHTRSGVLKVGREARDLFKIGWPGALMFGNEMICWGFFMVYLVGKFGPRHSTAGWIAHQWMTLSFMPAVGLSVAITASVGKSMGAGRPDEAEARAWLGLRLAMVWMTFCGVCFVVLRHPMVGLFVPDSTTEADRTLIIGMGSQFLIATAAFQMFDAVAMSLSGALRGAGDTRWPGVATLVLSWSIIVVGGLAMVTWAPQLRSTGPWIAAATYIALLAMAILFRFIRGRWKSIHLVGLPATAVH